MLICFDLDSTLLPRNKKLTPYTIEVFKKLKALGHLIVINSARHLYRMTEYINELNPDYIICDGGSLIVDSNNQIIYEDHIDSALINQLLIDLKGVTNIVSLQGMEHLYVDKIEDINLSNENRFAVMELPFNLPCYKILVYSKDQETTDKINQVLENYPLILSIYEGGNWGKISKTNITKLSGLEVLIKSLNLSFADCISFGDDLGDMGFLQASKISVCPKNSMQQVLEIVDYICDDIDNDGVAKWLESYFLLK